MRDILFKAKRLDYGEWVEGYFVRDNSEGSFRIITKIDYSTGTSIVVECSPRVDPRTICQYTGLFDKNGNKIFEGDIIEYNEPFVMKAIGVICYGEHEWCGSNNIGFYVKWVIAEFPNILRTDLGFWSKERELEVIGNIFDNAELLEG